MQAAAQLPFDRLDFRPHSLLHRLPLHREVPLPGLAADMREAQKVERFRFAFAPPLVVRRRKASELDQPGFVALSV